MTLRHAEALRLAEKLETWTNLHPVMKDAAAELRHLHALTQTGGWQPIETAPKDGSKFLAWRRHSTLPLIVAYNDEYDQYECIDGHLVYSLTHWQPLPPSPAAEAAAEREVGA